MPETLEKKAEAETKTPKKVVYCGIYTGGKAQEGVFQPLDDRFLIQLQVKIDKETLSTVPDESNVIDLVATIQTYRDQCGMEYALKMLKTGQATRADFCDDGKHSGTVPEELDTAQGRANAAVVARAKTEMMAKALGLPEDTSKMTDEQLSALISKTIAEKYPNWIQNQEVKKDAE